MPARESSNPSSRRPTRSSKAIRHLLRARHARQIPDILDCISDSGMAGRNFCSPL